MTDPIRTSCPYCGVGCGVLVERRADGAVSVRGDPDHPANYGRLCSKGAALAETLDLDGRLLYPEIAGRRVGWDEALDAVAQGLARTIRECGPESVAFYVSGQLLTEDYYVANKLMKGFLGAANIDSNSRLCMASSVAGHIRAFGEDVVPGCYHDLELARLVVLVGSNTAWCHPVIFQRLQQARRTNPEHRLVVIDPRRTETAETADLHLALAPGTDAWLFAGLLVHLYDEGCLNPDFVGAHTEGLEAALAAARAASPDVDAVARRCELSARDVRTFYRWFAHTKKTVTLYSQGINQSSSGTDKVNAIINCHLLTGRLGRPGMGPFSITGQPNAMGGREVGGLANQLAAHMDFRDKNIARLRRFWNAPHMATAPGLKAVELFEAVASGRIRALWIMATNPAVSLPEADRVRHALAHCPFVVVSDCVRRTDTTEHAHVLLPAAAWGEKDGSVTNSERRISRQRAFLPLPGEARPDWWIVSEVARRLGHGMAFDYRGPADIFREHARLSGFENAGRRVFDIGALATLSDDEYDRLSPLQWPVTPRAPVGTERLFANGRFATPSGRARFVVVAPRPPMRIPDKRYPLVLNTGRVRDQWHSMTRTGKSPRLTGHTPEPYIEINPEDAARHSIRHGWLARLVSRHGSLTARAIVTPAQRRGSVFVPIHWSDQNAIAARVGALVNSVTDPVSGQPEFKQTPVRLEPCLLAWHGFVLSRRRLAVPGVAYQVTVRGREFWRHEIAGEAPPKDWSDWARALLCAPPEPGLQIEWIDYLDRGLERYHGARLLRQRGKDDACWLESCLFIAPQGVDLPSRQWLGELFTKRTLDPVERANLVAGDPPTGQPDGGRLICACYGVGERRLREAIRQHRLDSTEAVGRLLHAGTNCGSCLPTISALLAEANARRSP